MNVRNLDLVKWTGVAVMLVDHVWLYVYGATWWSEAAGALAFPLFAVALAEGVKNQSPASRLRTLRRLLIGAAVAQACLLLVRDSLPLNVIFTLGLGLALDTVWRSRSEWGAIAIAAAIAGVGRLADFNVVGVALVFFACRWTATRCDRWLAAGVASIALLFPWNGNHVALGALPLLWAISRMPKEVPRLPNAFYVIYAAQWPLIALLARVTNFGAGPGA